MFMPVGKNTLIYIPIVRHNNSTQMEATIEQPSSSPQIRVIRYGAIFIAAMMVVWFFIAWYDSRH